MGTIVPSVSFVLFNAGLDETVKGILGTAIPTTVVVILYLYYKVNKTAIDQTSHWYTQNCDRGSLTKYANKIVYIAMACAVAQTLLYGLFLYWRSTK